MIQSSIRSVYAAVYRANENGTLRGHLVSTSHAQSNGFGPTAHLLWPSAAMAASGRTAVGLLAAGEERRANRPRALDQSSGVIVI